MKISNLNHYFSLKIKLILSTLIIVIGFLWLLFLIISSVNKTSVLHKVLENIERINSNVYSLITVQKDFMQKKELKYSLLFSKEANTLRIKLKKLKESLDKHEIVSADITVYKTLINNYQKTFYDIVRMQKIIGLSEEDALHKELRLSVDILLTHAMSVKDNILLSSVYALRKDEKDFMLRKNMFYAKEFNIKIAALLNSPHFKHIEYKNALLSYKNYFSKLVIYQKVIGLNDNFALLKEIKNYIEKIHKQSEHIRDTLIIVVHEEIHKIKDITYLFFFIITFFIVLSLVIVIKSILGPLSKLRNQYKDAIDECTIVSKTTPDGTITYVNDEFCKFAGYSKEELIGKNQNIIKHPDTKKDVFKEMWKTIKKDKKTWRGNIKNLAKDGSAYWVKTIIKPILNENDEIIEYISIRTDITEHEDMKEYFKILLHDESRNHSDTMNIAKEYRNALDEANIISVFNLDYEFVYVNEAYCQLTGYKKEELIGNNFNMIKGANENQEIFKEVFKALKAGGTWKGTVKNYTKDNKEFWTNVTYVAIKNEKKEVIKYMGIRHDITELFNLHNEIEDTQKEIIYKMGEVGESRSEETGNHVKRVAEYSKNLALLYGLEKKEAEILLSASPMHDIGKVGIPDSILKKPGKLSVEEFEIMKTHALIGFNILKGSKRKVLQAAAIVAHEHHEKWDGSGYPQGLEKEKIHIYARITAIADVFDALGSDRVYKKAWSDDKIFALFEEGKGKHFDPILVDLFLKNKEIFFKIRDLYVD